MKRARTKKEVWRDITGYEGLYLVSNFGRVASLHGRGGLARRIMKLSYSRRYRVVTLCKNGRKRSFRLHGVVMREFVGPVPEGMCINHKDGNPDNNKLSNLEYVTYSQNSIHAYQTGLQVPRRGEKHHLTTITAQDVREIRESYDGSRGFFERKAKLLGVQAQTISNIVNRRTWGHV